MQVGHSGGRLPPIIFYSPSESAYPSESEYPLRIKEWAGEKRKATFLATLEKNHFFYLSFFNRKCDTDVQPGGYPS
jgi:hypothetical protein